MKTRKETATLVALCYTFIHMFFGIQKILYFILWVTFGCFYSYWSWAAGLFTYTGHIFKVTLDNIQKSQLWTHGDLL